MGAVSAGCLCRRLFLESLVVIGAADDVLTDRFDLLGRIFASPADHALVLEQAVVDDELPLLLIVQQPGVAKIGHQGGGDGGGEGGGDGGGGDGGGGDGGGGVGPMTIACLLKNTLDCFKAR